MSTSKSKMKSLKDKHLAEEAELEASRLEKVDQKAKEDALKDKKN